MDPVTLKFHTVFVDKNVVKFAYYISVSYLGCGGTFNLLTSESAFIDMIGYKRDLSCTWLIKVNRMLSLICWVSISNEKRVLSNLELLLI